MSPGGVVADSSSETTPIVTTEWLFKPAAKSDLSFKGVHRPPGCWADGRHGVPTIATRNLLDNPDRQPPAQRERPDSRSCRASCVWLLADLPCGDELASPLLLYMVAEVIDCSDEIDLFLERVPDAVVTVA